MSANRCCLCGRYRRQNVSIFSWPLECRLSWIDELGINRAWFQRIKHPSICSLHFSEDSFIGDHGRRIYLKNGVTPFFNDEIAPVDGWVCKRDIPKLPLHLQVVYSAPGGSDTVEHGSASTSSASVLQSASSTVGSSSAHSNTGLNIIYKKTSVDESSTKKHQSPPPAQSQPTAPDIATPQSAMDSSFEAGTPGPMLKPANANDCSLEHVIVNRECLKELVKLISCTVCKQQATESVFHEPMHGPNAIPFARWACAKCKTTDQLNLQKYIGPPGRKLRKTAVLMESAAILSATCAAKQQRFMKLAGLRMISNQTALALRDKMSPIINTFCLSEKNKYIMHLLELQNDPDYKGARLAVDGQFDSPGHSASHCAVGVYCLMQGKIIMTKNMQKAETNFTSSQMETEGLFRVMTELIGMGIKIEIVCMDRSPANKKMMREKFPKIRVQHDIWHAVKKIISVCREIGRSKKSALSLIWMLSMKNHLMHIFMTANGNDEYVKREYRIMLLEHIVNNHKNCSHGPIDEAKSYFDLSDRMDAKEHAKLIAKLMTPQLMDSFSRCSCNLATSWLESHHNCRNHYLTKSHRHTAETHYLMSNLADVDTNSNPMTVAVDADGFAITRLMLRRDTMEHTQRLVYCVKDRQWMHVVVGLLLAYFEVHGSPLNTGRVREETRRRRREHLPFAPAIKPVDGSLYEKLHDRVAKRKLFSTDFVQLPPMRAPEPKRRKSDTNQSAESQPGPSSRMPRSPPSDKMTLRSRKK